MPGLTWIAIGLFVAVVAVLGVGAIRLRALKRRVGSFECGVRTGVAASATPGVAHYGVGRIDWWRYWSLSVRPTRCWSRQYLTILGREPLGPSGSRPEVYLVRCEYRGDELDLTMARAAYEGLASWLEAAPPGRRDVVV